VAGRERHGSFGRLELRRIAGALLDLLLPRTCVGCAGAMNSSEQGLVCGRCWARLAPLPAPRCDRCGHPTRSRACRWCDLLPPYVRAVRSVCWATHGTGRDIVHALKYEGWHRVSEGMAERMARLDWPRDVVDERTAVVPVPLAPSRQRERGYNQSERLADALARRWALPHWPHALERTRATQTQTRLTPGDRLRNVRGAFRVPGAARNLLRESHIVLVDDVVTTASTLNECASALCDGGARIVSYVTFGRAPSSGDRC
jgi:ComF family protein